MQILPHEIVYAIIFFFTSGLILIAWPKRHTIGATFFIGQSAALLIWVTGLFCEALSTTFASKILWSQISYIGFVAVTPFFFLFILAYTSQARVDKSTIIGIFIVPALILLAAWTNQWHHLLWSNFFWGSIRYNILIYEHGILFYLHIIFIYILVFYGLALLLQKIPKSLPPFRSQLIIIFISGLFPIISGSLYIFNIDLVQGMDTSSFGFLLTNLLLAFGFARYQLLDLVPVARDLLISRFQDGMIVIDWKNRIVEINQNAKDLLKISAANPIGENFQELIPFPVNPEELSRQNQSTEYCLSEDLNEYIELRISSLVPHSFNPPGYLMVFRDISAQKQIELQLKNANESLHNQIDEINNLQELLKEQATHDPLTGLYNRRLTDEVLNQQLEHSRLHNQPYSILIMDIDHFKNINDEYGHQTGDAMLQEYGDCILVSTRTNDFSCRLGGDEVLMAFQNMPLAEAEKKAEVIRTKLQEIVLEKENKIISTTVSIGIATFPDHGDNVKELVNCADQALYLAKERGRNQVVTASSVINT